MKTILVPCNGSKITNISLCDLLPKEIPIKGASINRNYEPWSLEDRENLRFFTKYGNLIKFIISMFLGALTILEKDLGTKDLFPFQVFGSVNFPRLGK